MSESSFEQKSPLSTRLAPLVTGLSRGLFARSRQPNGSRVHPELAVETWAAVANGHHNLTTDLIFWKNSFYLIHASSPWHIGSAKSRLMLWRSPDCREWEKVTEFRMEGGDIRDPKFAAIGGKLFLYVLRNVGFVAEPSATAFAFSEDGANWTPFEECDPKGWLFWRAKTLDEKTFYMPAYWHQHGKAALLKSTDGRRWEEVSRIHEGDHNDETDIEFLPDGRLLATLRLEISSSLLGHKDACTLISVAEPPYEKWTSVRSFVTRFDGPNLFSYRGEVFGVGRLHPDSNRRLHRPGSFLGKKRTAIFHVTPQGLKHLSDLPSCGDTGYPGVVVRGDEGYFSYYTNDPQREYRWVTGMFLPSEIRMAKVDLPSLLRLKEA